MEPRRVVIVGGGFAGVWAALGAAAFLNGQRGQPRVRIVLVSPDGVLVVRPRLYESDLRGVRVPLGGVLSPVEVKQRRATVESIDLERRKLTLVGACPGELGYDQLVLCAGSRLPLPGHPGDVHCADSYEEALALHRAVAALGEHPDGQVIATVVGAGFTGLELAAELAGMVHRVARRAGMRNSESRVRLVESGRLVAPEFGPSARLVIRDALNVLGVEATTGVRVASADAHGVSLADGTRLESGLVVWAAGPRASSLNQQLGTALDPLGRVAVDSYLATGVDGVWAAGDSVSVPVDGEHAALMSCQHAIPQGRQAGENAVAAALGRPLQRYRQPLYLTCLDLGSAGALLTCGFARDDVLASGDQAKRFKRFINRSLIYPPTSRNAADLLKLGSSAPPGRAAAAIQTLALHSKAMQNAATARGEDRAARYAAEESPRG